MQLEIASSQFNDAEIKNSFASISITNFNNLPSVETISEVLALRDEFVSNDLKYFVLIGIGGSNLGTKAIYEAMMGAYDKIDPNRFPKIIFLDTSDSNYIEKTKRLLKNCSPNEVLINVISKSGSTAETMFNFEQIEGLGFKDRVVATTVENSSLWELAHSKDYRILKHPENVGGRYSVFTTVGLFPLACVGIDIEKFINGGREADAQGKSNMWEANLSAISAIITFLNDKPIYDTFIFNPALESLGKWYRQLMGESLGKNGKGIMPTVSIGSTDLHSVGQLYLGGPLDKMFCFISAKPMNKIMSAIYTGTVEAYKQKAIPFVEIELEEVGEYELGYFMQFKMLEIIYLAQLMQVDPFDQPNVEDYKKITRELLSQ